MGIFRSVCIGCWYFMFIGNIENILIDFNFKFFLFEVWCCNFDEVIVICSLNISVWDSDFFVVYILVINYLVISIVEKIVDVFVFGVFGYDCLKVYEWL